MCDIVLLVYDQLEFTRNCIESILRNTTGAFRLLIIDNGSVERDTSEYLRRAQADAGGRIIVYRIEKNIGYVGGVNFGLKKTSAEFVCVMSNDTIVYPGWLDEMVSAARSDSRIGLVNPLWTVPKRFIGGRERYIAIMVKRNAGRYIETDWARGFCFLVTRGVIDRIGGLDEAYAPGYFDDWDYSVRAIRAGFKCARALGAFVWHFRNVTYGLKFSTESMRQKGKLFYGRWGAPLRILMLCDRPDPGCTDMYTRFVRAVLAQQDRIAVTSTAAFPAQVPHTNLRLRRINSRFMLRIVIVWQLWDNLRYSKSRRYDIIICSEGANRILRSLRSLRDAYAGRVRMFDDRSIEGLMPGIIALKKERAVQDAA